MRDPSPSDQSSRRGFVAWLAGGLGSLPFVAGAAVAGGAAATRPRIDRPGSVPVCKLGDVPAEGFLERAITYQVRRGPAVETVAEKVFVTRENGAVVVMSSRCTHLGCPVSLREGDAEKPFHCPCHDASFAADGSVLDGPPKAPLHRYEVRVPDADDGQIEVVLA